MLKKALLWHDLNICAYVCIVYHATNIGRKEQKQGRKKCSESARLLKGLCAFIQKSKDLNISS